MRVFETPLLLMGKKVSNLGGSGLCFLPLFFLIFFCRYGGGGQVSKECIWDVVNTCQRT